MNLQTPEFGIAPRGFRLPSEVRMGPVELQVADLGRSEEFYTSVLGLTRLRGAAGHRDLGALGGRGPLIRLVERPGIKAVRPLSRLGLYHFALLLPNRMWLARFANHLRGLGMRAATADHQVSEAFYLSDPDGLGIEVYADRPRNDWRVRGDQLLMTTDPLDLDGLLAEADDERFTDAPGEMIMGHVHLHVRDLASAEQFYHHALGFDKTVWSYPGALFLSAGGYHHHVATNTWASGAPGAGVEDARLLAWSLVLPSLDEVERLGASLAAGGYQVRSVSPGGPLESDDADGLTVRVIADVH